MTLNSDNDAYICESSMETEWEWIYGEIPNNTETAAKAAPGSSAEISTSISGQTEGRGARRLIGARNAKFEFGIGDAVLVNCGDPTPWIAIVRSIDQTVPGEEKVDVLWLSKHTEVTNKRKKRKDYLPNELYLTPLKDSIGIDTIDGTAQLMSETVFNQKYPKGISQGATVHGSVFICRRGCEARGAIYTDEFTWEDVEPRTQEEVDALHKRIISETQPKKKRSPLRRSVKRENDSLPVIPEETPRKKQKFSTTTPKKPKTPMKLVTPSHKRVIIKKPLEFTPLATRTLDIDSFAGSPFKTARSRLHVSAVPTSLPCREDEFTSVYSHLEAAIFEGSGACIYISGPPGTGKTATVREVVAQLEAAVHAEELDPFNFVEINGMKMTDPAQSYSILWQALKGDRLSSNHALDLLQREFSSPSPRRIPCVVLMDELDQLVTRNQSVMYNFFNWPGLPFSRLIVLAVANTMDLPERTLSNKISSRLGLTRITFPGYSFDQLVKIISTRLENIPGNLVEKDAIEFASRKVAAVSGDARRALDICRRAVELAESDVLANPNPTPSKTPIRVKNNGIVRIETIRRAIKEATTSPLQNHLRELPLASKVFLVALVIRMRRNGTGEDTLGEVLDEAKKFSRQTSSDNKISEFLFKSKPENIAGLSPSKRDISKTPRVLALGKSAISLMEAGIIGLETWKVDRTAKVRLAVGEEDVKIAFNDDPEVKNLGL
ncbi:unnamed protein product [Blumeria hordei]|uniref:Origin recognition complex subunit 1 n=1 Tax=Blumeria hordei TaxID=2867405 RepID=A0A383UID2_BLUHO|nr:unnamed protein product [Blumeria hordei]